MIAIYLDGATLSSMQKHWDAVSGFTSNPSLMKAAGTTDYKAFASEAIRVAAGKPISFEVLADDPSEIRRQAGVIDSWGNTVYCKIPVVNSRGESNGDVIRSVVLHGIKVNVTAIFTLEQVRTVARVLSPCTPAILSIFAGRIADTGVDPMPLFVEAQRVKHDLTKTLWASTREVYNVKQAEQCGADIITCSPEILNKLSLFGKDLSQYSTETSAQFFKDAQGITF